MLPANSITTWDGLVHLFLGKYFPPSRSAKLIAEISSYQQWESESLYEAWEGFRDLLRKCPHHGFPIYRQLQLFYNGLSFPNRSMIDAACGGTIMKKSPEEAYALIDEMAASSFQWQTSDHSMSKRKDVVPVYQAENSKPLTDQIQALIKQVESLMKAQDQFSKPPSASECDHCGSISHNSNACKVGAHLVKQQEEANFLGNNNNYNSGWRGNSSNSWGNHQGGQGSNVYKPPQLQNQWPRPERREPSGFQSNFQETMIQFVHDSDKRISKLESQMEQQSQDSDRRLSKIESQLEQITNMLTQRPLGALPSQPVPNPREHVMAITLRSGKELAEIKEKLQEDVLENNDEEELHSKASTPLLPHKHPHASTASTPRLTKQHGQPSVSTPVLNTEHARASPSTAVHPFQHGHASCVKLENDKGESSATPKTFKPKVPFPQKLKGYGDPEFFKFLEIFKQLRVNIPFLEALSKMPKYAKYLKEILSSKKKLEACVELKEECSTILSKQLPPKLKDPGSFTVSCSIGHLPYTALCDLGASINLMPFSEFKRMGLEGLKPTSISLQLADRSITRPKGIVENVLVQVNDFLYPVDFVVMDIEEGDDFSIILGRPFLATAKAIIDVPQGKLTLQFDDKELVFNACNFKNSSFFHKNFQSAHLVIASHSQELKDEDPLGMITNKFDCNLDWPKQMIDDVMVIEAAIPNVKVKGEANYGHKVKKKGQKHPSDLVVGSISEEISKTYCCEAQVEATTSSKRVASHALMKPP